MPGHRKRKQFKQTDAFTRGMVIGLKRAGWSIRQIAADTHLGASTVHRMWRRWLKQGNVAIYRNVGATRVTSARVDRRILRQAVAAPQATCTAILQHVQDTLDHSISTRTISRRLVANGLHSCRPLRRLPLTPPNRRQRLEWCRARSTWVTEWHRVVFSDESSFCLSSDSRRVRVWRRRGERSNPAAIVERPTVRQRGIMVWGAIVYDSRSPLLRIQGTMTAQRYVDDVLRPVTLPYLQGVPNALYQQDNARPHTARISQKALQRSIPQDAIRTLIDSLPRGVAACISVRGASLRHRSVVMYRFDDLTNQPLSIQWHNLFKTDFVRNENESFDRRDLGYSEIMREDLGLRKLSARWVPKPLTPDQKAVRRKLSSDNLALFVANPEEFVNRFVTMDETWAHHFTSESKQQSMQWRHSGSPPIKKAKTVPSAGKTIYDFIHDSGFELLPHAPYSPDLAPSDMNLFPHLKKSLSGIHFRSDEEVIDAVTSFFESSETSFFLEGIKALEHRWKKCIDLKGNYVEGYINHNHFISHFLYMSGHGPMGHPSYKTPALAEYSHFTIGVSPRRLYPGPPHRHVEQ
ncbi:hypothetical protein LAZ67_X003114 [Cordylochernes scorpioides]|uniref:Transposase Tc1-like domain-containing protein n=1 Tax=Cordylochernes scorpioides TaxID=51811 RepID=A0ABY6LWH7_9ARAC|nr:hypothetical protein LAZ67_X003114 [Cordylochernes scorpioides]